MFYISYEKSFKIVSKFLNRALKGFGCVLASFRRKKTTTKKTFLVYVVKK